MTWDRIERLIGADNLQKLAQKRVGVVGLGSGGGFVAQSLAMSGVSKFILVDDDTLEENNVVRHVADRRDIGRSKAEAVADLIRQRNPNAEVDVRIGRIEQHMDILESLDILVVGVDGENAKYTINQACLERGLVAVYAGVYERGEGGDVVVIRPYDGPCYACWAAELREGLSSGINDTSQELDYGMIGPKGTLEAEPGLWLHVVKVATVQADLVLNELLRGTPVNETMPGNTIILANNALEIIDGTITPPHTAIWVNIERDPNCLVCGPEARRRAGLQEQSEGAPLSLDDLAREGGIIFEEDEAE
jgi:molybdopterin/thiamine biosynthesis adenylyltransferase